MFSKLNRYLYRNYLIGFLIILTIFSILIFTGDLIENFRKSAAKDVPINIIFKLSYYNFFSLIFETIPIIVFFSCIFTVIRFVKNSEYTVMQLSGSKQTSLLVSPIILFFLIGIIFISTINPLTVLLHEKHDELEYMYIKKTDKFASISKNGIWLKQNNIERNVSSILNSKNIEKEGEVLNNFMILEYNDMGSFTGRFDGKKAILKDGYWLMHEVIETPRYSDPVYHIKFKYVTSILFKDISNSLSSPENISLWNLPGFIKLIEKLGYSALDHELQLYYLLSLPLLICGLVALAYSMTLRIRHNDKIINVLILSIGATFLFYFFSNLFNAMSLSSQLNPIIAKFLIPGILFFSSALIINLPIVKAK